MSKFNILLLLCFVGASNVIDVSAASRAQNQGKIINVPTSELKSFAEQLYKLESKNNRQGVVILNYQGTTSNNDKNDVAPQPLFSQLPPTSVQSTTMKLFHKLLDNYVADVRQKEDNTHSERQEIKEFLNALSNTPVMKKLEGFLKGKGFIRGSLRPELEKIWFTPYTRSKKIVGSSGFEHVFLGEIKHGGVSGFHNWAHFAKEEKEKDLDYKGLIKKIDVDNKIKILKMRFHWMNKPKSTGSLFVGTTPELEMALYTLCFYTRPNKGCNLKMNNKSFRIKTYLQQYRNEKLIGSAFPEVF